MGKSSVREVYWREDPKKNYEGSQTKGDEEGLVTAEFRISEAGLDEVYNVYVR